MSLNRREMLRLGAMGAAGAIISTAASSSVIPSTFSLMPAAPAPLPRAPLAPVPAAPAASGARIDPVAQRARDSDARRILESELKAEEDKLEAMQKEFNSGQPERRGDEKNYQKYIDRVGEMSAAISRKQTDVAAIRRELQKMPPPRSQ